ncbi:hypothetical protein HYQ46_012005 [Verticillium longisporum]|nr:hypothetical protein HYQ46_012005 [Verticillium longisporum]
MARPAGFIPEYASFEYGAPVSKSCPKLSQTSRQAAVIASTTSATAAVSVRFGRLTRGFVPEIHNILIEPSSIKFNRFCT